MYKINNDAIESQPRADNPVAFRPFALKLTTVRCFALLTAFQK
jgi:hypothetical protein